MLVASEPACFTMHVAYIQAELWADSCMCRVCVCQQLQYWYTECLLATCVMYQLCCRVMPSWQELLCAVCLRFCVCIETKGAHNCLMRPITIVSFAVSQGCAEALLVYTSDLHIGTSPHTAFSSNSISSYLYGHCSSAIPIAK